MRASGYGIRYSVAIVIPSFSGIYLLWLSHLMPYLTTPIVLIVIAPLFMMVGALMGTRDKRRGIASARRRARPSPAVVPAAE